MSQIQIGATTIDYNLKFTNRQKTIGLQIDLHDGLSICAPKHLSIDEVEQNIHKKSKWIIKNIDKISEIKINLSRKEFLAGEKFPLRGRNYKLKVKRKENAKPTLSFYKGTFTATMPKGLSDEDHRIILRPLFLKFYRKKSGEIIKERVKKYQEYSLLFLGILFSLVLFFLNQEIFLTKLMALLAALIFPTLAITSNEKYFLGNNSNYNSRHSHYIYV